MILVIDNYDSFTYNLVQALGALDVELTVHRNDAITPESIAALRPSRILLSPGPGRPEDAGITVEVIRRFGSATPILGVCLGHQAIGMAYGGTITNAPSLMHGRTSLVRHGGSPLYANVPSPFEATRYHSLVIDRAALPESLSITSETDDQVIMGVRHRTFPVEGVQFHPESILTTHGIQILRNWLERTS